MSYVQEKFPNLKVFILDMGGAFPSCPSSGQVTKVSITTADAFDEAFDAAFDSLKPREPASEAVCQRVRDRLYPDAVSY